MTENSSNVFFLNTKENPWCSTAQSKLKCHSPTNIPTSLTKPVSTFNQFISAEIFWDWLPDFQESWESPWYPCWLLVLDTVLRFPAEENQFAGFISYLLALIADKMNLTVKWCIIKGGGSRSGLVNGPFNRIWNWIILLDFNPIQRMDFLELIWRCNSEDNHCLGITKIMMDVFQGTGIWN